ncbi:MAG: hypothetical protein AAF404_14590, partial [Pseudomonadota bacterium]
ICPPLVVSVTFRLGDGGHRGRFWQFNFHGWLDGITAVYGRFDAGSTLLMSGFADLRSPQPVPIRARL